MQANHLEYFAKYIETQLGIVYSPATYFQLENRLVEIMTYFQIPTIEELRARVEKNPAHDLKQLLLDTATNNETSFFRDMRTFDATRELILPALKSTLATRPIRIWSAAASTGQEAYSLAMLLHEIIPPIQTKPQFQIIATDISQRVLTRVQEGLYSQLEVQRGLPTAMLLKYFVQENDGRWKVNSTIKSYVTASRTNLCESFAHLGTFDIVYCRNVLIYQNVERKVDILRRVAQRLQPKGFLVMGAGESLIGLSNEFSQRECKGTIVYQLGKALEAAA